MTVSSSDRADGEGARSARPVAAPVAGRTLASLVLPLAGPSRREVIRDVIQARREAVLLRDAITELAAATTDQHVTTAMDRLLSRFTAAGVDFSSLDLLGAMARDRVRPKAQVSDDVEERLSALVEQTADVILIVDDDNRIRYASPSARTVLGTSVLRGRVLTELVVAAERRPAEYLLRHARQSDAVARADWTIHALDGRTAKVSVSCRDLRADESVRGVVVTLRDVSAQRDLEHELTKRVFYDPFTGLANRLSFTERVVQAGATGTGIVGVIVAHIDDFRAINDGLGRETGDAVLTAVATRLRAIAGDDALAARIGGDEFAVLVGAASDPSAVTELAASIADTVAIPVPGATELVSCTASLGVATTAVGGAGAGATDLLSQAELAMNAAREAGKGQCRLYEPSMISTVSHRLQLRSELSRAVQDGSLVVEYQPIVALDTRHTVGFEALVRWRHATRGLLGPDAFIDVAEESGLITAIGDKVLATALNDARDWARATPHELPYVSVNVSVQQFRSSGFVDRVREQLGKAGLPPGRLVLEITENLLMRDEDQVWEDLNRLRHSGVRIAIDDFGTGYSALGYLRQTPLDIVKLDRLFTSTMATSERQRDLVHGIVRLTQALHLDVVAEGIETERQREIAAAVGCAYGQGYLFARSMPYADALTWLARDQGSDRRKPPAG